MSLQTSSSVGRSTPFDLNSQAGVMQLLAAVRASELSPVQKNELRDLVFLYSNGGGDQSVRIALLQKLDTYKIVPVLTNARAKATQLEVARPFGVSRPAPAFSPVMLRTAVSATAARVLPRPVPTVSSPVSAPVAPVAPVTVPPPTPIVSAPVEPAPIPAPVVVPPVVAQTVPPPVVPPPAPVSATPPPVIAPSVPVAPAAPVSVGVVPLERIRQIKLIVNQKVGNPVNLVDIDNAVGREYMMALLEAMKKVGGGIPGELEAAMVRLEAAFLKVEETVAAHARGVVPVAPPTSADVPAAVPPPINHFSPVLPSVDSVPAPEPATRAVPVAPPAPVAPAAPRPVVSVPPPAFKAASLAQDKERLLTPNDLPDAATRDTGNQTGDPLHTEEVDTGLDQLLLEWSIFKKSGLFGTGPKGSTHPLFKELAPLTLPLILAGRYDGATQEIRQSITDYMNGWRYEQGLIYEQEETFEHYLRRVIRHIIDLQKRRTSA